VQIRSIWARFEDQSPNIDGDIMLKNGHEQKSAPPVMKAH
jgi:hypothetical protein